MPRNAAGTYALPAGNPVVTATTISSVWANTTLSDIGTALTGSLARNGDGGMTGQLKLADGAIGAPGLTWGSETTSGLYRAAVGDHRYSIAAADKLQITTNGLRVVDGAVATPGFSFISDTNTGIWRKGTDRLAIAAGGVDIIDVDRGTSNTVAINIPTLLADGALAAGQLSLSFIADTDTGIYRVTTNYTGFAANGAFQGGWNANGITLKDGTAPLPSLAFDTDPDTGIYRPSANVLAFSAGGVVRGYTNVDAFYFQDGTALLPSISFMNDGATGLRRAAAGRTAFSASGVDVGSIDATRFGLAVPLWATDGGVGTPGIAFLNDTNTGLYRPGSDFLRITAGGADQMEWLGVGATALQRTHAITLFSIPDGSAVQPSILFESDLDTGLFRAGTNALGIATAGANHLIVDDNGATPKLVVSKGTLRIQDGTIALPGLNFDSDPDTGFYRDTANQIGIGLGGVTAGQIAQGSFTGTLTGCTTSPTTTFNWQRIGNHVMVWCVAALQATSNALTCTVTGAPAAIRPASNSYGGTNKVQDNSVLISCTAFMTSAGVITFTRYDASSFNAAGGTKGPEAGWSMIYPLF